MTKQQSQIIDRIHAMENGKIPTDPFGFEHSELIVALTFDNAKPWLHDETTEEEWSSEGNDPIAKQIADYLPFALGKMESHRGLSTIRSISHFRVWAWLDGKDELVAYLTDENNYTMYGAPMLKAVIEEYSLDLPTEEWFTNMAAGEPCRPGCEEGCGT